MANPPLTKQKTKWVKNRKVVLRGNQLNYNAGIQISYHKTMQILISQMTYETKNKITKLFNGELADDYFDQQKEAAVMDASIANKAKILMNKLTVKFQQLFNDKAKVISQRMVNNVSSISKANLYTSLKQLSGGLSIKTGIIPEGMEDVISASVNENVSLIKSIPSQYLTNVSGAVMRSISVGGKGLTDLLPIIRRYGDQTDRRAKNIALDQTRKVYNNINKQRMQAIGVKQFEWRHSHSGQHPRKSHMAMNKNIYSFDDLPVINQEQVDHGEAPVRGIPGQAINCRCTMTPVIKFKED